MGEPRADDATVTGWALAAGAGDCGALTAFIRATQRDVYRFLAHLNGPHGAEDLAQETYLRALRSLPRFAGRSSARTWLLCGLEPDRRDAFVLTQVLDLSYAEAAEVCGCPVGTIRSRVARAREDLVSGLAGHGRDTVADG